MSYSFDANRWCSGSWLGRIGWWFIYLHSGRTIHTLRVLLLCSWSLIMCCFLSYSKGIESLKINVQLVFYCISTYFLSVCWSKSFLDWGFSSLPFGGNSPQTTCTLYKALTEMCSAPPLVYSKGSKPPSQCFHVNIQSCVNSVDLTELTNVLSAFLSS